MAAVFLAHDPRHDRHVALAEFDCIVAKAARRVAESGATSVPDPQQVT